MGIFFKKLKKSIFRPIVCKKFTIGTKCDSPSEHWLLCVISSKLVKKWQSYGHFGWKNLKKSILWTTVRKKFDINITSDSPSEDGFTCKFSSKSAKKWQSYGHFCLKNLKKSIFWPTVYKKFWKWYKLWCGIWSWTFMCNFIQIGKKMTKL